MDKVFLQLQQYLEEINYISPWMRLDDFDWSDLTKNALSIKVKKGEILYWQAELSSHVHIVKDGRFRLFRIDESGEENSLAIAEKGSMIGELSIIDSKPNFVSAIAIVDSTLYRIKKESFKKELSTNIELCNSVLMYVTRMVRLQNSTIEYANTCALTRVAISFISLCVQYGISQSDGIKITIKFTHEELANMINLNRVTVSKIYRELTDKKVIKKVNGYIVVTDILELERLARE